MKAKIVLILLALAPSLMQAQSKINLEGLALIQEERAALQLMGTEAKEVSLPVIIRPETADCLSDLAALGIEAEDLGVTLIADVPIGLMETVAALPSVKHVTVSRPMEPMMNFARPASGVTEAQEGVTIDGTKHKFDGKGVVVSLFDSGLDANHVNFLGSDGETRVKRIWVYGSTVPTEYSAESRFNKIKNFTTDSEYGTHGTHVAGIMGGSYNGPGTYCYTATGNSTSAQIKEGDIPFYGVATEADLAFACGPLQTPYVLSAINKIINYANSQNEPAVINLSLGTTLGPHDGTDDFSTQLAEYGKRAIICMAAGNEGGIKTSIVKKVGADAPIRTFFSENKCEKGLMHIWANDSIPLTVSLGIYNMVTGQVTTLCSLSEPGRSVSVSNTNSSFAANFTGSISMSSNVDVLNKRYNVNFTAINFTPLVSNKSKLMTLIVEGKDGQTVYIYGNAYVSMTSEGVEGYTEGVTDNSLNSSVCTDNVISVGAYNTCLRWGLLGGGTASYSDARQLGAIAPFSGYGKSFQGKQYPYVCAPGATIMSSYNRYYVNREGKANSCVGKATDSEGITNYWGYMQGTSQATPYVTGTVGLWLQACPTLTFDQVMEVLEHTSTMPEGITDKAPWGYGKIEAAKGLQYILKNFASIGEVWRDDEQRLVVVPSVGGYNVVLAGEASFDVTVYDLQGRMVANAKGTDGSADIDTSALGSGVYVLRVSGPTANLSQKIAVR